MVSVTEAFVEAQPHGVVEGIPIPHSGSHVSEVGITRFAIERTAPIRSRHAEGSVGIDKTAQMGAFGSTISNKKDPIGKEFSLDIQTPLRQSGLVRIVDDPGPLLDLVGGGRRAKSLGKLAGLASSNSTTARMLGSVCCILDPQ